jgi:hypothetical protein
VREPTNGDTRYSRSGDKVKYRQSKRTSLRMIGVTQHNLLRTNKYLNGTSRMRRAHNNNTINISTRYIIYRTKRHFCLKGPDDMQNMPLRSNSGGLCSSPSVRAETHHQDDVAWRRGGNVLAIVSPNGPVLTLAASECRRTRSGSNGNTSSANR